MFIENELWDETGPTIWASRSSLRLANIDK